MTTTLVPITPTRVVNFATILPLFTPAAVPQTSARQKPADVRLARRGPITPGALPSLMRSRPSQSARVQRMESATLTVPRVVGSLSPDGGVSQLETVGVADLSLPLGISRFVNVATLKRMLKAKRSDVFLRRAGDAWEICADSMKVDLADASVEFRMGTVQIYS